MGNSIQVVLAGIFNRQIVKRHWFWVVIIGSSILLSFFIVSLYNYLLFHSLAEMFSIFVASCIFIVTWNTRHYAKKDFLLILGISFLSISALNIIHMLSYKGMGVFVGVGANIPTQLWIAERYLQSLSLLIALFVLNKKLRTNLIFTGYFIVTALILLSIFYWQVFPLSYIENKGLTSFKIVSEYVISTVFLLSALILYRKRQQFDRSVYKMLLGSILIAVAAEISFTLYVGVYGLFNIFGHLLLIVSLYLMYKAIAETGLVKPINLLFWDLKLKQKKLKESEARLRLVIQSARDGVVSTDQKGIIVSWNKGAEVMFGFTEKEALGQNTTFLMPQNLRLAHSRGMDKASLKNHRLLDKAIEGWGIKKNGLQFPVEISLASWRKNKKLFYTAVIRDITERKELEKRKDDFISIASHELKTPITTLKGFAQILRKRVERDGSPKDIYLLDSINYQTEKLISLVNDLLDVSKLEAGRLVLEKKNFDLNKVVEKIVRDFQYTVSTRKIIIKGKIKDDIIGDQDRISQVISNLITNAIKYSPDKSLITVEINAQNGWAIISVHDQGNGINRREQTKIFDRFYRTKDSEQSNISGFGLGLYITSEIVKYHQGKIWVKSKKGQGSTFSFSLPLIKLENGKA